MQASLRAGRHHRSLIQILHVSKFPDANMAFSPTVHFPCPHIIVTLITMVALMNGHTAHARRDADNGDLSIELYLREIGQVKRLTPREEIELVGRIKMGDWKARQLLIKGNLRRVVKVAQKYENLGLPLLDLISEGNLGLLKAVERFDPAEGRSFSSCSTRWIEQSIKLALTALRGLVKKRGLVTKESLCLSNRQHSQSRFTNRRCRQPRSSFRPIPRPTNLPRR